MLCFSTKHPSCNFSRIPCIKCIPCHSFSRDSLEFYMAKNPVPSQSNRRSHAIHVRKSTNQISLLLHNELLLLRNIFSNVSHNVTAILPKITSITIGKAYFFLLFILFYHLPITCFSRTNSFDDSLIH